MIKAYAFPILLLLMLTSGGLFGFYYPHLALEIKPLGNLFLNSILTTIVPVVFFSVSSSIAQAKQKQILGQLIVKMIAVFLITGLVASLVMLLAVYLFPICQHIDIPKPSTTSLEQINVLSKLVNAISVSHFFELFNHEHMLALILFAILIGIAGAFYPAFVSGLKIAEQVFTKVFSMFMFYAPIGFFAYFAAMVSELGTQILPTYLQITILYYAVAIFYFMVIFSIYAYLAGSLKLFWQHIWLPVMTALATCSSAATIPVNLDAVQKMRVRKEISETVIPLGTLIHKEGSILGGMLKIAFLFSVYHMDFNQLPIVIIAVLVSILVGTVMGAIPSGGMLGELLILNVYGFPPSALMMIAAISLLIDPIATMLNTTGNTINAVLINKFSSS